MAEDQRALAAGDVDAIVAAFQPDGYAREPAGGRYIHRGPDGLRAFDELLSRTAAASRWKTAHSSTTGRAWALEYNVVRWGKTQLPPQAGVAVYVRVTVASSLRPESTTTDPPLGPHI